MLDKIKIKNFGLLPNSEYQFAAGLNVIVGENGLGKSQLLKLLYSVLKVNADTKDLTKIILQKAYADKLVGVFRPDALGRLVKRKQGRERCEVQVVMKDKAFSCSFRFASQAKSEVQIEHLPAAVLSQQPVYFPTRELVTLCPWFGPLYDNYYLRFEESWCDTVSLLSAPSVKGAKEKKAAELLKPLEAAMGGKVVMDAATGAFYLNLPGEGNMEMPLVAEGLRKLAMLARLVSTGALLGKGYLFWDGPEINLNPKLIKVLATSILQLCRQGTQVFIATHSLYLLRELEILAKSEDFREIEQRYFGLRAEVHSESVTLEQGDSVDALQTLVVLDEELLQSDRFLAMDD